jgi:cytochrome P450 family 103
MTIRSEEKPRAAVRLPASIAAADLEQHAHSVFRHHRPLTPLLLREDGVYIAIRAADVEWLATDPRTRQLETEIARSRGVTEGALFDFFRNTMLLSNGAEHRRRRTPLARAFAAKVIDGLRPRIRAVANEVIDRSCAHREMSFIDDYAATIPARVLCEVLGLPEADIPDFTRHVYTLARALSSTFSPEDVPELEAAAHQLTRYADELLESRHMQPRSDLLTSYIREVDESGTLLAIETLIQVVTVILAGSDTTRGAMAIQTSLLLQHREQWSAVCQDAGLIPGAVSESLRYEPSVGSFTRVTLEDIEIDRWIVPRNRVLSLSTMSAMRDPVLYADPDKFDITRTDHPRRHLVFGAGAHRCLGQMLARAELEEGLATLAARLPHLQLANDPPIIHGSGGVRSVKNMRVRWS